MQLTVLLVLAILILLCGVFVACRKEWALPAFCILVGVYCLVQQLPTER